MQNQNDHGNVIHNGKTLSLTQEPYIDNDVLSPHEMAYFASAEDTEGNEYKIKWEITAENPKEVQDDCDMCNWDEFTVREL